MPKPKTTLGARPAENEKIAAFLAEEPELDQDQGATRKTVENTPESTAVPAIANKVSSPKAITKLDPKPVSSSLSELMQSREDHAVQSGMVKRNFSVSRGNMNYIKRAVQIANNAGVKKTQDDVLNEILEDWFKTHGWH